MSKKDSEILDNSKRGSVVNFIKEKINSNFESGVKSNIDIVSAYFTIYAFQALKKELTEKVANVNFILGEPSSVENLELKNKRSKIFKIQDENITLQNSISQNKIAKECYNWLKSSNVQIRTAPKKDNHKTLIHGKMYYIEQENNPRGLVDAVIGSSNFTSSGLGINDCSNYELNTILDSQNAKEELKEWFNELWNENTEDAKTEILNYIKALYKENTPEQVYLKTLYEIFSSRIDNDIEDVEQNKKFTETIIWNKLFSFQKAAVNSIWKKLNLYNGCILADSVGLGKTFTALGVIQYFICNKKPNVLVIAPKRLAKNWKKYERKNTKNPFINDRLEIDFKTHTELTSKGNENFDWGDYDLVVIDESHNFRNATRSKIDKDGNIKTSRYDKLMDSLKNGRRQPKVLLLSATPVNTSLRDLKNQIRLISLDNDDAFKDSLDIPSLNGTIKAANTRYMDWAKSEHRNKETLLEKFDANFFNLLDALTIARSRKQIKNYFQADDIMTKIPKRKNPIAVDCGNIDIKHEFMSIEKLNNEIEEYSLALYKPTKYLIRNYEQYNRENRTSMTQEQRENYLINMMKMGFLKRLESSIASFNKSMENVLLRIDERLYQIEQAEQSKDKFTLEYKKEEVRYIYDENEEDDFDYNVGKKLVYDIRDLDTETWKQDLKKDRKQIEKIYNLSKVITPDRDSKLNKLKTFIIEKSKLENKKLLIFTSFSDTAEYLYKQLSDFIKNDLNLNVALVTGNDNATTYGDKDFDKILENFSPKSKLDDYTRTSKNQIDILICTDCISEGQNLQDCDTLINYDIHWNPVRLIQRFGRIDRIGSDNKEIQMINFWPTKNLESYINLQNRVEARMTLVDQTATADDDILQTEETDFEEKNNLSFREKQIQKLMEEQDIEDIEDSQEDLSITDFSMEDFHSDLRNFLDTKKDELERLPIGLNTVIPNIIINKNNEEKVVSDGIIFCLRQKNKSEDNEKINKLQPYYLVYVKNDGNILYTYEKSKKILDLYRELCLGKTTPYTELCNIFNKKLEMEDGLAFYNDLLKVSVDGISKSYKKEIAKVAFSRGGFIPSIDEQVQCENDFELISWLIITGEENVA